MKSWFFPQRATEDFADQLAATGASGVYGVDPVDGDSGYRRVGEMPRDLPWWTAEKARAFSINAYRANPMARAIIETYCVDEETEILTAAGWRRYDEVAAGDEVFTLNHNTGLSEWQPILSMHIFPAQARTLMRLESRDMSAFTTVDHRWPVVHRAPAWNGKKRAGTKTGVRAWETSESLRPEDWIVRAAPAADTPAEPKWSDDLVELVAWTYTEGHIRDSGAVTLTQSHVVNGDLVVRIEAALRRLYGAPRTTEMRRDRWFTEYPPQWQRRDYGNNARFFLNREAAAPILAAAPGKVPMLSWLRTLTPAQLRLFIDVSLMGDGDTPSLDPASWSKGCHFAQVDHRRSEAFQYALILAGVASGTRIRSNDGHLAVSVHKAWGSACRTIRRSLVEHDGIVWCPRTANGSWFARRDGRSYFTGNTSFCVGDSGLTLQCPSPEVKPVADEFWDDPRNAVMRTDLFLRDHLLMGETVAEMMVGASTGVCRFSIIDPFRIEKVGLLAGNPLWPSTLQIKMGGGEPAQEMSIAAIDDLTGLRVGDVLFWASFKALLTDRRGVPFLAPIIDDLNDYDTVLSNLIDRTAVMRYIAMDVTVDGDQKAVDDFVKARGGTHVPRSGTIEAHNKAVEWKPLQAQVGAEEDRTTGKAVLTNIAGGAGLAKTWLAEPEDANRATSLTMAEPVRRRVGGVQNMWLGYLTDMARYAVDQAVRARRVPEMVESQMAGGTTMKVRASSTVQVTGPEIAAADAQMTAEILVKLSQSLAGMVAAKILSPEAARVAGKKAWEQFVGVPWTSDLDVATAGADDLAGEIDKAPPATVTLKLA